MANRQVSCINKTDRYSPHERIRAIGGHYAGSAWKHTEDQAIRNIKYGAESYYVSRGGSTVRVIVATRQGHEYLKTEADGETPDNLLSLPECP